MSPLELAAKLASMQIGESIRISDLMEAVRIPQGWIYVRFHYIITPLPDGRTWEDFQVASTVFVPE
jgi:hypothetical protein